MDLIFVTPVQELLPGACDYYDRLMTVRPDDLVITIGPLIMMKFVVKTCQKHGLKSIVSMNPIMIDGTGMCGGCRLTVGGQTKFACVDGPDFDGDLVDFDEAMARGTMYRPFEAHAREAACNLFKTQEGM